ncbi:MULTISPECIES: hypothetical protein [unclassified Streptomyces]|uniref:hypothetical protein n=1 Tax=unclassified Streptomyces TaxID=2593676 RepID=UPI00331ED4B3
MAFRYRCGECGFSTSWSTQSQSEDAAIAHYADRHPGLLPGGSFEVNRKNPNSPGCLPMVGITILLLVVIDACQR